MTNCEEKSCADVPSAICLHCNLRLCTSHIVAHGELLLKEANELHEQIDRLAEHLNISLQNIQRTSNQTWNAVNIWRQKQIDMIEDRYARKMQAIGLKQNHLVKLENNLSQRLVKDAREPLNRMQTQNNANSQVLQAIRQTIADIEQESAQLQWSLIEPSDLPLSFNSTNTATYPSQQYYSNQTYNQQTYDINLSENQAEKRTSINPLANQWYSPYQLNQSTTKILPSLMNIVPMANSSTNVPYRLMNPSGSSPLLITPYAMNPNGALSVPRWSQPTVVSASPVHRLWSSSTTAATAVQSVSLRPKLKASTESPIDIKRLPKNPSKKLIAIFLDVSSSSDIPLNDYITRNLNRAVHVNNMMLLLLSFLEAWYPQNSPNIFNERILSSHIFTIKKYINGREHELTIIAAIQVFIDSCALEESRSGQMMIFLLRHFYDHKCLTKETILDWYENGASYGYNNFHKAKQWATPLIDQLHTDIESKQT